MSKKAAKPASRKDFAGQFKHPGGAWVRTGAKKRTHFPSASTRGGRRV